LASKRASALLDNWEKGLRKKGGNHRRNPCQRSSHAQTPLSPCGKTLSHEVLEIRKKGAQDGKGLQERGSMAGKRREKNSLEP